MSRNTTVVDRICEGALAGTALYCFDRLYNDYACRNGLLKSSADQFFSWKGIDIFYKQKGAGSPVILLHSLHPAASAVEWSRIEDQLAEEHTVYIPDLPGCGRSGKPDVLYTNFYYVDFLRSFINGLNISRPVLVASNLTASVAVSLASYEPALISHLVLINPPSLSEIAEKPGFIRHLYYRILKMPFIGTTVYTVLSSRPRVDYSFSERYFYNPFHDTNALVDAYFESAHLDKGHGHFFAASLYGGYLRTNLRHSLEKADIAIKIIEGRQSWGAEEVLEEWLDVNPKIENVFIEHTRELPMLEEPDRTVWEIKSFI